MGITELLKSNYTQNVLFNFLLIQMLSHFSKKNSCFCQMLLSKNDLNYIQAVGLHFLSIIENHTLVFCTAIAIIIENELI